MHKTILLVVGLIFIKTTGQTKTASTQDATLSIADSLYVLGNYSAAINEYSKVSTTEAAHQIARSYDAMGNHSKAILQYESVIEKDSSNLLARFELGKIYDKTKKFEESQTLFAILTEGSRTNPEFYYYLGKAQQTLDDYNSGNKALAEAVMLDSTHLRSIYLLGKYYVSVEEPGPALEIIDLGLKSAPDDVALINLKALAYFNNGYYKEAAELFERLVELGEGKPFVLKKLAYAHFKNWQFEKANKIYRQLAQVPNMEADAYFGMGETFLKAQQLDSAEVYFKKSIEERRYIFDQEYASLGRVARLQNNTKKALDYYTKAWEENKSNQFYYYQVCTLADEHFKDSETVLNYYEKLLSDFPELMPFIKERAQKRITELREEIHFGKN